MLDSREELERRCVDGWTGFWDRAMLVYLSTFQQRPPSRLSRQPLFFYTGSETHLQSQVGGGQPCRRFDSARISDDGFAHGFFKPRGPDRYLSGQEGIGTGLKDGS
jgi:hypothetical protein